MRLELDGMQFDASLKFVIPKGRWIAEVSADQYSHGLTYLQGVDGKDICMPWHAIDNPGPRILQLASNTTVFLYPVPSAGFRLEIKPF